MKVGIVGAGAVGSTAAYALIMRGIGREVVLVDRNTQRAGAEVDDLRHAVPFAHPLQISQGEFQDLAGCRVVLLCAGVGQKPGETRLQLLQRNADVFREIVPQIVRHVPDAVLVVATNPVDVMTHLTVRFATECGLPAPRVLGSGTTLDTARFRSLLGAHCGIDSHHVHGHVIGEHGDSEVLTWSLVTVGGMPLNEFLKVRNIKLDDAKRAEIDTGVRRAAYSIIAGKGATYYGVGSALARIVDVILHDQRAILTVCSPADDIVGIKNVTLSLPRIVGGTGVQETLWPPLNNQEETALRASAEILRNVISDLDDH